MQHGDDTSANDGSLADVVERDTAQDTQHGDDPGANDGTFAGVVERDTAQNNDDPVGAPLLHVVLDRPAIAGNVGACVRLCAAVGAALHVCGSELDPGDRSMWRAGLDYWPRARVHFHHSLDACLTLLQQPPWIVEVGGDHTPWDVELKRGDVVVLGPEKASVQADVIAAFRSRVLTLPQRPGIRSLNLSQVAAVVVFEAVRQQQTR